MAKRLTGCHGRLRESRTDPIPRANSEFIRLLCNDLEAAVRVGRACKRQSAARSVWRDVGPEEVTAALPDAKPTRRCPRLHGPSA